MVKMLVLNYLQYKVRME